MSKIIKNTIIYTIGNVFPDVAAFVLLPIYTRYLSPADYGIVNSLQVLNAILAVVLTLAIERSVTRLYWDHKTENEKKEFLGTIVLTLLGIATAVLALLFLLKDLIALIYSSIPFYPFYVYAIITAYFSVFERVPKLYLRLKQKAKSFVILSIMQFVTKAAFILWFIVELKAGAAGMLKGQMIGTAIMAPIFLFIGFKIIKITFKPTIIKESLKYSLPMIPVFLSSWVLNLSDRIFLERYCSLSDVGIYSLGYKIGGLVLILASAFSLAYEPVFYKLANSDDQLDAKKKLFFYNNSLVIAMLLICFFISFFSKEAITILLDARYIEAYKIVPIIALAYFIAQSAGVMNRSIYQEKKTVVMMIIMISSAMLNIMLNFMLVPKYGVYGAAFSTVLSFTGMFIVEYWYAKKCYFIDYDWKLIIKGLLVFVPLASLVYFIEINIYLSLLIKLFIVGCMTLFFFVHFKDKVHVLIKHHF